MKQRNIGIALSGGVDSTAAALMLRENYTLTGFFMQLAQPDVSEDIRKVKDIAARLEIPIQIIDLQKAFTDKVLDYFRTAYYRGTTPNPCMICNTTIKFGLFLDSILAAGMDMVATGHYAQVFQVEEQYQLHKGRDLRKEQSYFLALLNQQQLARVLFPIGHMEKEHIYTYVERHGFPSFRGKESQDVCFLKNTRVASFLEDHGGQQNRPGAIVNTSGDILGRHEGIFRYTVGQRRGLGISAAEPYYVLRLDSKRNTVVVGNNNELNQRTVMVTDLHWISGVPPRLPARYLVKIRYTHRGDMATLTQAEAPLFMLRFDTLQRAVTPGQFAVFYDNDRVIGAGVITSACE